jgi:hypothetical protein
MPWSEGSDNSLLATGDAQGETNCGTDHERQGIVAHAHQSEIHAFGVLALGYFDVTLPRGYLRIGPDNGKRRALSDVLRLGNSPGC